MSVYLLGSHCQPKSHLLESHRQPKSHLLGSYCQPKSHLLESHCHPTCDQYLGMEGFEEEHPIIYRAKKVHR
ncbi:hypothetical protein DPMN_125421 [Dreissena polymorpha]|uniref:Uncharacterized protein n=1 Tax=Dreissena polymorpha TaxID=45954 RepID=A0A9D4JTI0_DREPO|nr:hypothetical protein DPMN_125421 [Dreissena polymorpha]